MLDFMNLFNDNVKHIFNNINGKMYQKLKLNRNLTNLNS